MMPQKKTRRIERRRVARADASLSMRVERALVDGAPGQTPHYLAPLSKVMLTIVLPGVPATRGTQRLLKCEGVVVRCLAVPRVAGARAYELACSFLGLDERLRRLLSDFVAWRNVQALPGVPSEATRARPPGRRLAAGSRPTIANGRVPGSRSARPGRSAARGRP
ncbi:MAG: hypothetical protein E6K78_02540 [Candidatus Eisenbacteria bacterium]|uniref:PilZ domain-containing protein n=1 Tax=Eiseniibacteriota bacterium TaxID=2212470 RepID=A0A538TWN7_UNCEI|nr:MAG: hypothetical protein E6K78_02540 [Candidatus Eisenbacteria bacterium]